MTTGTPDPKILPADYKKKGLEEFDYNPLIEALPDPLPRDSIIRALMIRPPYHSSDRQKPYEIRLDLTQRIINSHMPTLKDLDIYTRIGKCIRWGYENRNPLKAEYARRMSSRRDPYLDGAQNYFKGYHPNAQGFAIIGVSGIGKSTTVESILDLYPQVIRHTNYEGIPLQMLQVVWMKLECPGDGSLKSLCLNFFRELDRLTGTDYFRQYSRRHTTLDQMQNHMSQLCMSFNVGLLVIDEIQGLRAAKGTSQAALNFFVSLVNTVCVPVIMIGTPKALNIFQCEFQQAKRGSGQGDILWNRMEKNRVWNSYLESIWHYQYTRDTVPLTDQIRDAVYDEAQGIPFIASHLYKLVQEDAILLGKETFDAEDFHRIASKKMGLTEPMRRAIRSDQDVDVNSLERSIAANPVPDCPISRNDPIPEVPKESSVLREATLLLTRMDISYKEAEENVLLAMNEMKEQAPAPLIARRAVFLYMEKQIKAAQPDPKPELPSGYNSLKEKGMIAKEVL